MNTHTLTYMSAHIFVFTHIQKKNKHIETLHLVDTLAFDDIRLFLTVILVLLCVSVLCVCVRVTRKVNENNYA